VYLSLKFHALTACGFCKSRRDIIRKRDESNANGYSGNLPKNYFAAAGKEQLKLAAVE
jgi:hypothetical protein